MNLDEAYDRCEEITRTEARNFSYGIRLLPFHKRRAMSALYAVARRIDDIGDSNGPVEARLDALADVGRALAALVSDPSAGGDDPVLVALADASRRFPIPMGALDELVDGCRRDVVGATYATFDDLVGYCRLVAGTVGRLSLGVYGQALPGDGATLADDLGVALQLTNILRDIVEDREAMGRVYLPADDLVRFGCDPDLSGPRDAVAALVSWEAALAVDWYDRGLALLPLLDRRSRAATAAMAGIYRRLLDRIQRDPASVLDERVSVPGAEKARVAAKALILGSA